MSLNEEEVNISNIRKGILDRVIELDEEPVKHMSIPDGFSLSGWVYVLSNPAMPGIYKIGMTTTTPENRAKEISQGTGVPLPYVVELAYFSDSPRNDEEAVHEYLDLMRLYPNREFFKCDLDEIKEAFDANGLYERGMSVEQISDHFHVITFNRIKVLNLTELFEDIGIRTFGDELSIAEGLIRMPARTIKRQDMDGMSILIDDGKITRVVQETTQQYESYLSMHPDKAPKTPTVYKTPF